MGTLANLGSTVDLAHQTVVTLVMLSRIIPMRQSPGPKSESELSDLLIHLVETTQPHRPPDQHQIRPTNQPTHQTPRVEPSPTPSLDFALPSDPTTPCPTTTLMLLSLHAMME